MNFHHSVQDVFKEKERIGKLSQIREFVLGAQDGLLVPLGVITSVAGAFNNNHIVIIAGVSEALAGAFSMATGAYLSSRAEKQLYDSEIVKETKHFPTNIKNEKEEMALMLRREGMKKEEIKQMVNIMAKNPKYFIKTMIHMELGIDPEPAGAPLTDALYVGGSYLVSAAIPLFPYFFITGTPAMIASIGLTLIALFSIGLLKAKFAILPYLKSGLEVFIVGASAGIGGYYLGMFLPKILGIK